MLLKALTWVAPGGPILSAIGTFFGAIVTFFATILKWALEGFAKMLANPATFVTAGCLCLICFAGGMRLGMKWDAHLVKAAAKKLETVTTERDKALADVARAIAEIGKWKERFDDEEQRAAGAVKAREKAEADVAKAMGEARAARGALDRYKRLRHVPGVSGAGGSGSKKAEEPGLFASLQALFGGGQ